MTEIVEGGDWHLRGLDIDQQFALDPMPDNCVDAANRAQRCFGNRFPGWSMYARLVRGERLHDRQIAAWAISIARGITRAKKINGHSVVALRGRRNDWIAQCALDAIDFVIFGRVDETARSRAAVLNIHHDIYGAIRNTIIENASIGIDTFRGVLFQELKKVKRESSRAAA
jgi:hypothetical protein